MTVALCLLTWNELEGAKHDVPMIDFGKFDQVYCIDGGSTDNLVLEMMVTKLKLKR